MCSGEATNPPIGRGLLFLLSYSPLFIVIWNIIASSASVSTCLHDGVQTSVGRNALVSYGGQSMAGTCLYPSRCPCCTHTGSLCVFTILGFAFLWCRIRFPVYAECYEKKGHCFNFMPLLFGGSDNNRA